MYVHVHQYLSYSKHNSATNIYLIPNITLTNNGWGQFARGWGAMLKILPIKCLNILPWIQTMNYRIIKKKKEIKEWFNKTLIKVQ